MEHPEIFCARCKQPNRITEFNVGGRKVPVYYCGKCGVVVKGPKPMDMNEFDLSSESGFNEFVNKLKNETFDNLAAQGKEPEIVLDGSESNVYVPCDRCGARAASEIKLPSEAILAFCQHHLNKHREALESQGGKIKDTRPKKE